jgi:flavin-dependent dehydrogenase
MPAMPSQEHSCDVLIVGGGPAGAASACFLAAQGLEVQLLDRAQFPRPKACAEYLSPEASRLLAALGVLEAVEQAGAAQLSGMTVRAANGREIRGEFVAAHGFRGFRDRGLALPRTTLDPILLDAARRAGVRVREGVRVVDLLRDDRGAVVGVRTASASIRASLVIGADGLRSIVARRAGLAATRRWAPRRLALVAHFEGVDGIGRHGEMHVQRNGYVGLADVGGGRTNVALVVPTAAARGVEGDAEGYLSRWLTAVPRLAPRFRAARRVSPVLATGPFARASVRAYAPGVALVGDAAEFFDPFTGEGIYSALRGAELLAPHAARAVAATRAGDRRGATAALAAYEQDRRAAFVGKWRVERLIGLAVSVPPLLNHVASVLEDRRDLADLLVGVAGDFVPPSAVLRPSFVWSLLRRPSRPRAPVTSVPSIP